jgi:hypothetical protein
VGPWDAWDAWDAFPRQPSLAPKEVSIAGAVLSEYDWRLPVDSTGFFCSDVEG